MQPFPWNCPISVCLSSIFVSLDGFPTCLCFQINVCPLVSHQYVCRSFRPQLVLSSEALKTSSSGTRATNSSTSLTGGSTGSSTMSFAVATPSRLSYDLLGSSLMQLIATILSCLSKKNPSANSSEASAVRMSSSGDAFISRVNDIVRWAVVAPHGGQQGNDYYDQRAPSGHVVNIVMCRCFDFAHDFGVVW